MTPKALNDAIIETLAEELAIDAEEVTPDLAYGEIPEWDSIAHMHIVAALEEKFEIVFDDTEISELSPVSKLVEVVAGKATRAA